MKQLAYDFGSGERGMNRLEALRQKLANSYPHLLARWGGRTAKVEARALIYDIIVYYEMALDELDENCERL